MSKQRNLIALDWLMPVLQDVFGELNQLLQQHDTQNTPDWQLVAQHLHQITGALALVNQPMLSTLAKTLETAALAINKQQLPAVYLTHLTQAVLLLQFELQQAQAQQQIHQDWVVDRIGYFEDLLGIQRDAHLPVTQTLAFLSSLPAPSLVHRLQDTRLDDLLKLWRYNSLQLLQQQQNNAAPLTTLGQVADYLAGAQTNSIWRKIWRLVAVWCHSLLLNEHPTPNQYAAFLSACADLISSQHDDTPDETSARLAVDVLLQLTTLAHKTEAAKTVLQQLDLSHDHETQTFFGQVLAKLEKVIYQLASPLMVLPWLEALKASFSNRGWVFYDNQLAQIIDDVRLMSQDDSMTATLGWQVERQLQDLYSQLLSTAATLTSEIGMVRFAYAKDPQKEAVRQTRVHLENIKLSFNQYTQRHTLNDLTVNDDFVAMIQVFGALGFSRPQELIEQIRLLFSRIQKNNVQMLSWEVTNTIADMIARFELFLDYLASETVNDELLDQTQTQLNRATLLLSRIIETPLQAPDAATVQKHFEVDTLIYDDEGEHLAAPPVFSEMLSTSIPSTDVQNQTAIAPLADTGAPPPSAALVAARQALKPDDYSMDEEIREIFIEEADEVLAQMATQIPLWEAAPQELLALKDIRRGFHTLKGSGRMVGAHQVAEMCWAIENMLNRVLDHTVPTDASLVQFIKDTHQQLPTLVNDFANQHPPRIDPAITVVQANNLLQQLPRYTGLSMGLAMSPESAAEEDLASAAKMQNNATVAPLGIADTPLQSQQEDSDSSETLVSQVADTQPLPVASTLPQAIQTAYDNLPAVADNVTDPDIQAIYIEEANEVIENITPINEQWQTSPENFDALKELRRGFHTLKGSGRMVGANQLGELAWAVENMLNRVLDHTIPINAGILALVNDVIKTFDGLIEIFAQNLGQYPNIIKFWQAVADAYGKKQGDSFDYIAARNAYLQNQSASPIVAEQPATANQAAPSSMLDTNLDTNLDMHLDTAALHNETTQNETTQSQSAEVMPAVNATDEVFLEEADELLATIEDFINHHQGDSEVYITDEVVRAFHTLRGGAALIDFQAVYALSAALEETLGEMLRKETPLSAFQMSVLKDAKHTLQSYIMGFQQYHYAGQATDHQAKIDAVRAAFDASQDENAASQLSVEQLMALNIDTLLDADLNAQTIFAAEEQPLVEYATELAQQAKKLADATQGLSYSAIASALQQVCEKITQYPQFAKNEEIYHQFMAMHNQLINMFDAIAAGLKVNVQETAITELAQLLAIQEYQAELAATTYETLHAEDELLGLFLEETQALKPEIEKSFNQWLNHLSNQEIVQVLSLQLHTLKGGAELIGIRSIAALAERGEQLYQAIQQGKLPSDTDTAVILQKVYATLDAQQKQVKQQNRAFYADDLVQQLDAILAGNLATTNLRLSVPAIVRAAPELLTDNKQSATDEVDTATVNNDPLYIQEIINNFEQRRLETWQGQEPDEDILSVYLEEVKELIDSSSQHLQEFRSNNSNISALQALQRELHTIKGGARMVGAEGIATLSHEMETIYEELGSRRKPATRMIGNLLAACHDWLASAIYVLENKFNPQTPFAFIQALQQFSRDPDSLTDIPKAGLASQIEQIDIYKSSLGQDNPDLKQRDLTIMPKMGGNFEIEQEQNNLNAEMLRISANTMERMINLSGESAINRSRIEMGMTSLTHNIEEMGATVQRLADQLRRMETELEIQILAQIGDEHRLDSEFDPLEMDQYSSLNQLSKSLSESASDLLDIKTTMLDKTRETENLLLQLSRTQADLQEGLMDSRTVPFSRITPRLQRIVRQTSTELGKTVELRILNDEGEIDRNILERITSPLEHMLRNAVDHGIEKSQERIENGKSRTGLITLEVQREGGEIVIHLTDDGRGINVNGVRQKAIEQGLISAKDTSLKPLDIMQYIFNAGLSTAKSVSQISGRGVGMDVVQSEVKQLGGVVLVDSDVGKGSRFTMRLPLTVAVSDALMVRAGDKYFAVPLVQIERVMRINVETVADFYATGAHTLNIDGEDYRLRYLNQILYGSNPIAAIAHQNSSVPVIIVRTELGQRLALQVDMIAGARIEVIVKPLGRQLSHIAGISAATIMGDGSVLLILDLVALMRNVSHTKIEQQKASQKIQKTRKPTVLIVDDSVTVRKVTSRLVERYGYEAHVAIDGIDALEKLQEMTPDAIVLDIEMPRMDGFEVANHVRHNTRLKHVPIIMITSRTGEKHRERALSIGVNEYMGKPFQEQALIATLNKLSNQLTG
jgi:chemosensory pili system protein ChpA (sensor histidine kinase/response regulator)